MTPVYDKVLIKKLEEDIKKAAEFLDEDSKEWWGEFFKGVRIQGEYLGIVYQPNLGSYFMSK